MILRRWVTEKSSFLCEPPWISSLQTARLRHAQAVRRTTASFKSSCGKFQHIDALLASWPVRTLHRKRCRHSPADEVSIPALVTLGRFLPNTPLLHCSCSTPISYLVGKPCLD